MTKGGPPEPPGSSETRKHPDPAPNGRSDARRATEGIYGLVLPEARPPEAGAGGRAGAASKPTTP